MFNRNIMQSQVAEQNEPKKVVGATSTTTTTITTTQSSHSNSASGSPDGGAAPSTIPYGKVAFRAHINDTMVPALRAFNPDLILISAGFDAGHNDMGCVLVSMW
jgi:hypothetical protein